MIALDSLGIDFVFNGLSDVAKVDKTEKSMGNLLGTLTKVTAAIGGIYGVGKAISSAVDNAADIKTVADRTGEATETISALGRALQVFGGDANEANKLLEGMTKAIIQSRAEGGEFSAMLHSLGVDIMDASGNMRPVSDILMDIGDKWQTFDDKTRGVIADKLNLPDSAIKALWSGGDALRGLVAEMKALYAPSAETVKSAENIVRGWEKIKVTITSVAYRLSAKLFPAIEMGIDFVSKFAMEIGTNFELVDNIVTGFVAAITTLLIPALTKVALVFAPILLKLALLSVAFYYIGKAIRYVIEDFQSWKRGGESAFGDVWDAADKMYQAVMPKLEDFGKALVDFWKDPKKATTEAIQYFRDRWKGLGIADIARKEFKALGQGIREAFNQYIDPFLKTIDGHFKAAFGFSLYAPVLGVMESAGNAIDAFRKGGLRDGLDAFEKTMREKLGFTLFQEGDGIIRTLWDGFKSAMNSLWEWFALEWIGATDTLYKVDFFDVGRQVMDTLIDGFKKGWASLWETNEEEVEKGTNNLIVRFALGFVKLIAKISEFIIGMAVELGLQLGDALKDAVGGAWDAVVGWFTGKKAEVKAPEVSAEAGQPQPMQSGTYKATGPVKLDPMSTKSYAEQRTASAQQRILEAAGVSAPPVAEPYKDGAPPVAQQPVPPVVEPYKYGVTPIAPVTPAAQERLPVESSTDPYNRASWENKSYSEVPGMEALDALAKSISGLEAAVSAVPQMVGGDNVQNYAAPSNTYNRESSIDARQVNQTISVSGVRVDVKAAGDAKDVASGMANAIKQEIPNSFALDGALSN